MSLLKFYIRRRKVQVYQLSSDVWLYTFRSTANELFQYYSIFSYSRTFISKQDYWQLNLNLYNKTLSKQDIIKRKKEKSTIPSNELFARCQSSMLERTGKGGRGGKEERGWKKLQRRCGRWKAVKSREQKKADRTAFEREGKNVYRAWATSYPALLFTGLPGAPELEVARFVSVPLPRRSIGNNYPVRNRRPPLIIPRSVDEKDFFLILLSLSPSSPSQDKIELSRDGNNASPLESCGKRGGIVSVTRACPTSPPRFLASIVDEDERWNGSPRSAAGQTCWPSCAWWIGAAQTALCPPPPPASHLSLFLRPPTFPSSRRHLLPLRAPAIISILSSVIILPENARRSTHPPSPLFFYNCFHG